MDSSKQKNNDIKSHVHILQEELVIQLQEMKRLLKLINEQSILDESILMVKYQLSYEINSEMIKALKTLSELQDNIARETITSIRSFTTLFRGFNLLYRFSILQLQLGCDIQKSQSYWDILFRTKMWKTIDFQSQCTFQNMLLLLNCFSKMGELVDKFDVSLKDQNMDLTRNDCYFYLDIVFMLEGAILSFLDIP